MSSIAQILAAINQSPNYSGVVITPSAATSIQNVVTSAISVSYLTTNTAIVVITGTNGLVNGFIVDTSGSTPTIGPTQTIILSPNGGPRSSVVALSSTTAVLFHGDGSNNPLCCVLSISGTTITKGTSISTRGTGDTGQFYNVDQGSFALKVDSTTALVGWGINGGAFAGRQALSLISVSGTTATRVGSANVLFGSPSTIANDAAILSATQGVLVGTTGTQKVAMAFTISGTTISFGTSTNITQWSGSGAGPSVTAVDTSRAIAVYAHNESSTINTGRAKLNCFTVSGTTVSLGNEVMFTDAIIPSGAGGFKAICMTSANRGVSVLTTSTSANATIGASFTLAGTVITKGAATILDSGTGGRLPAITGISGTNALLAIGNSSIATNSRAINITLS